MPSAGVLSIQRTMDEDALTPLHPDYVKVMRIGWLIGIMPLVIAALLLESGFGLPRGALLAPAALAALFAIVRVPLRRYHARGYHMAADRLRVARGVLFRSDTVVPFGRVQHIDVHQGPVERAYGLGTLVLHTAGNHNASVSLPGLAHGEALAMRETIRAHVGRELE